MKTFFSFFLFLFLVGSFSIAQDISVFDIDLNTVEPADTIPPAGFPLTQKFNFDYTGVGGLSAGTVGAIFYQGKYYFNRWNAGPCYTILPDANGAPDLATMDSIPIPPYLGNIRDMTIAMDGGGTEYLWGGAATGTLNKMDAGMNVIASYTTGGDFRAIAYDPVTGGFWSGDFSGPVTCYDTTGALLGNSATGSAIASKYGAGFSTPAQYPGVNSVWWWSQLSSSGVLTQVDLATDAIIAQYTFTGGASAGGAEVCMIGTEWVLLLNFQNVALTGYVLSVVPVELTSFTANVSDNDVTLNWSTSSETNNQGFEIQRSSNGNYERVGYVVGNGTATQINNYSFTENNLPAGVHYYRLKQIDFDGTFEYYQEISVEVIAPAVFTLDQNYPNPFNPSTKIDFRLAVESKVSLTVFNVLGQEVATLVNNNLVAGAHSVNFDASALNSGVYLYRIEAAGIDGTNFVDIKKMTLTK